MLCLVPFVNKAFHVDDPLFVWAARHIREHPADFYGFRVNWYFDERPMADVTKNPPLACYYLALAGTIAGWSEPALHVAFLLPALAVVWGTYRLAESLCLRPVSAALATLFAPVFLVSATTVMSDTLMLAFWVWALVYWRDGLDRGRWTLLLLSTALMGLAVLTKYFAISLVPLAAAYALARRRRAGAWLLALAVPVAVLVAYQAWTVHLYGQALLSEAVSYAGQARAHAAGRISLAANLVSGLAFTGGCVAPVFFFLPLLWGRRGVLWTLGLLLLAAWGIYSLRAIGPFLLIVDGRPRTDIIWQAALYGTVGALTLFLAANDLWRMRDGSALLLFLWVAGTFVFAALLNWGINARSILPLAPAVGVLLMRQLDRRGGPANARRRAAWPLVPAAALALAVALADYRLANAPRTAVDRLAADAAARPGRTWSEGHWGFQYYMQEHGIPTLDSRTLHVMPGDVVDIPLNNYGLFAMPAGSARLLGTLHVPALPWLTTMNPLRGAGFYLHRIGPLPFSFGPVPEEPYEQFLLTREVRGPLTVYER